MRTLALLAVLGLSLTACEPDETPAEVDPVADAPAAAPEAGPAEPVNLNTGTEEDFLAIPGVGDRMVHEFEEYRPYTSVEQFRREIGKYVDEEQVAAYEQYVFVPIDVRQTDAATLDQLPGVGEAEAAMLAEGLPYASADAFLTRYAEVVPEADREAAARYLAE